MLEEQLGIIFSWRCSNYRFDQNRCFRLVFLLRCAHKCEPKVNFNLKLIPLQKQQNKLKCRKQSFVRLIWAKIAEFVAQHIFLNMPEFKFLKLRDKGFLNSLNGHLEVTNSGSRSAPIY